MRRPIIFVLLAGFAALVAAMVVYSALKKREAEVQQAKLQSVEIVVAAHALGIGTKLDPTSVKSVRWSRDSLPPGAFTDQSAVINKYTKTSFVENEPIVADWLFNVANPPGAASLTFEQTGGVSEGSGRQIVIELGSAGGELPLQAGQRPQARGCRGVRIDESRPRGRQLQPPQRVARRGRVEDHMVELHRGRRIREESGELVERGDLDGAGP